MKVLVYFGSGYHYLNIEVVEVADCGCWWDRAKKIANDQWKQKHQNDPVFLSLPITRVEKAERTISLEPLVD